MPNDNEQREELSTCEIKPRRKPGPKGPRLKPEELQIDTNIYACRADIDFLLTWNQSSPSLAFSELIGKLRNFRPNGRFSSVPVDPESRNRPGTKTSLKREIKAREARIAALERQIRACGLEPVKE